MKFEENYKIPQEELVRIYTLEEAKKIEGRKGFIWEFEDRREEQREDFRLGSSFFRGPYEYSPEAISIKTLNKQSWYEFALHYREWGDSDYAAITGNRKVVGRVVCYAVCYFPKRVIGSVSKYLKFINRTRATIGQKPLTLNSGYSDKDLFLEANFLMTHRTEYKEIAKSMSLWPPKEAKDFEFES